MPACYSPPQPACGFVCGTGGACPADYTCKADHRCHLDGTAGVCAVDAGLVDAPADGTAPADAGPDARPDAPSGDTTAPFVLAATPPNTTTGVAVNTALTATFNEAVTGVSGSSFTVAQGATAIAGGVTYNAGTRVATFTPTSQLPANATITASLTAAIADLPGNPLVATGWHFDPGPDTVAPALASSRPLGAATAVPTSTTITVVFDEPVVNVSATTFTIAHGVTPLAGTVAPMSGSTTTYVLTPTAALPAASTLTVTLSTAITDTSSNALPVTSFSFTTS